MRQSQFGFTLVELVIAVGLIALMASIAGTAIPAAVERSRLQQGSTLLVDAIRKSQISAVRQRRMWRVIIDPDGRGFSEEYATSTSAATDCSSTDWQAVRHTTFPDNVTVSTKSKSCVSFSVSGRTGGLLPQVDLRDEKTTQPHNGGHSRLRLTDGYALDDTGLKDPYLDPADPLSPVVEWTAPAVQVLVGSSEQRYYSSICLGLLSLPDKGVGYPSLVIIEGAPASAPDNWTLLYEAPGPADTPDRTRTCAPVMIGQELGYFRISLWAGTTGNLAIDEVDLGDLFFNLTGRGSSKQVLVSPVTGRVRVR